MVIVLAIVSIEITSWMLSGASWTFLHFKSRQSVLIIAWLFSSKFRFFFYVLFDAKKKQKKNIKKLHDCS